MSVTRKAKILRAIGGCVIYTIVALLLIFLCDKLNTLNAATKVVYLLLTAMFYSALICYVLFYKESETSKKAAVNTWKAFLIVVGGMVMLVMGAILILVYATTLKDGWMQFLVALSCMLYGLLLQEYVINDRIIR